MVIELETEDKLEYTFYPNNSGFQQFRVRASNDAHVALSPAAAEANPMYEMFIGGWGNTKSVIRKNRTKPDVTESNTPGILNADEFRGFWIRWDNGNISAGREGEAEPFLNWTDLENVPIEYFGVCTGWGANGSWLIEEPRGGVIRPTAPPPITAPTNTTSGNGENVCWVAASNGEIPPSAFAGGEDNGEPVHIIRASFNGGLLPGKLISSHGVAYVPWGGKENPVSDYEVLCSFNGNWVACNGGNIPSNAVPAGQTEDGEPLYVGRTIHDGALTVGKVQPSHGVLYIPYSGSEMGFQDFEILTQ